MYLFFLAAIGAICVLALLKAYSDTRRVQKAVITASNKAHFHQMMGFVILVAHASEIGRVVSHISWLHLLIALFLFVLWFATRTGGSEDFA